MFESHLSKVPTWTRALPFFSSQCGAHFYFKPFVSVLFGKQQPKVFPLKVFLFEGQFYCTWPAASQFLSLLERSGIPQPALPSLVHHYAVVGFAHPDRARYTSGYPWEAPSILLFGGTESHYGDIPPSAWIHCEQKETYVLIVEENATTPSHPHDQESLDLRVSSYQSHLPDLGTLLPYPTEDTLRKLFSLDDSLEIPASLLPPQAG
jgi:hypothetical protein